jgi:hypothetical protein
LEVGYSEHFALDPSMVQSEWAGRCIGSVVKGGVSSSALNMDSSQCFGKRMKVYYLIVYWISPTGIGPQWVPPREYQSIRSLVTMIERIEGVCMLTRFGVFIYTNLTQSQVHAPRVR